MAGSDCSDSYSPARLADRAMITDVLHRYCKGVDRLDFALIRDSFHPDAVDEHSMYSGGVDGLIEWIRQRHAAILFSMHTTSNVAVEFPDRDTAYVESCCQSTQRHRPAAVSDATDERAFLTFARYLDVFTRRAGAWRIQHRTAVYDDIWQVCLHADSPTLDAAWTLGTRDRRDPSYTPHARWREQPARAIPVEPPVEPTVARK
ncbi:MAG: nuclear transport factor 2 family protein [Lautropia sp.]